MGWVSKWNGDRPARKGRPNPRRKAGVLRDPARRDSTRLEASAEAPARVGARDWSSGRELANQVRAARCVLVQVTVG